MYILVQCVVYTVQVQVYTHNDQVKDTFPMHNAVSPENELPHDRVKFETTILGRIHVHAVFSSMLRLSSPVHQVEMICLALLCICMRNSAPTN